MDILVVGSGPGAAFTALLASAERNSRVCWVRTPPVPGPDQDVFLVSGKARGRAEQIFGASWPQLTQIREVLPPESRPELSQLLDDCQKLRDALRSALDAHPLLGMRALRKGISPLIRLGGHHNAAHMVCRRLGEDDRGLSLTLPLMIKGGNPFEASAVHLCEAPWAFQDGVFQVAGGSRAFADLMQNAVEASGGRVIVDTMVQEAILEGQTCCGVRLRSGEEIKARHIVSDIDPVLMYTRWFPDNVRRVRKNAKIYRHKPGLAWLRWSVKGHAETFSSTHIRGDRYSGALTDVLGRRVAVEDAPVVLQKTLESPDVWRLDAWAPAPNLRGEVPLPLSRYVGRLQERLSTQIPVDLLEKGAWSYTGDSRYVDLVYEGAPGGTMPGPLFEWRAGFSHASVDFKGLFLIGPGTYPGLVSTGALEAAFRAFSALSL